MRVHLHAFKESEILVAESLAGLLSVVLAGGRDIETWSVRSPAVRRWARQRAFLMERHKLSAEEAFDVLCRTSQDRNVNLVTIAEELVTTGPLRHADAATAAGRVGAGRGL